MKRYILIIYLLYTTVSSVLSGDDHWRHHHYGFKCYNKIESTVDSIDYYEWNSMDHTWIPSIIENYIYEEYEQPTEIIQNDYYTGEALSRSIFINWVNDLPLERYDQQLIDNQWVDKYRSYYQYYENGLISELIIQHWRNNDWLSRSKRNYYYNQQDQIELINISIWNSGTWIASGHQEYLYSPSGKLIAMHEYKTDSLKPWRIYKYKYDELGFLVERLIKIRENQEWINSTKYLFVYDELGIISEFFILKWNDNVFENKQKRVYHNTVKIPKKIIVCHKGKEICISSKALKAHLDHGDKIGKCDDGFEIINDGQCEKCKSNNKKDDVFGSNEKSSILDKLKVELYPLPADDYINVRIENNGDYDIHIDVLDTYGRIKKSLMKYNTNIIKINCSDLDSGIYFIRLRGKSTGVKQIIVHHK